MEEQFNDDGDEMVLSADPEEPKAEEQSASAGSVLQNKLLRMQADFDNYRRRTTNARGEAATDARREVLADLLPIYDNFIRALEHAEESPELLPFLSGFEMIRQQFEQFMKQKGLEEISAPPGAEFDPNIHEAAGMIPLEDGAAEGTIARELQKGFTHKGAVVRPARVLVYSG